MLARAGGHLSKHGDRRNGMVDVKALPPPGAIDKITPPHDLDAEAAVISATILDPNQLDNVGSLQPPHFYSEAHHRIWEAILSLRVEGSRDPRS